MPSMVAHDFAADRDAHDFAADRDVTAALPRRTSRRYPMVAGEEGKHDGGVNYDDGYDSAESVDDDRDGDFVPKEFEYSNDDEDFNHLLDDDDINEEDRRIEKMDSKLRISTGRCRGTVIPGGPVAPNY